MAYRCNTYKEKGCSVCCVLALLLAFIATIFMHVALFAFVPAARDLPDNIIKGFNDILNFGTLEADAKNLQNQTKSALTKCNVNAASQCNSPGTAGSSNPNAELTSVVNIFDSTLKTVQRVTNDKYLGLKDFAKTGNELTKMMNNIKDLKTKVSGTSIPCAATNTLFCQIYKNSQIIVNNIKPVKDGIDKVADSDAVKAYSSYASNLRFLHAMAYIFWLSMIFYLCFFAGHKPKCVCRGGSCKGCCACCTNGVIFMVFWVLTAVIVGAGYFIIWAADSYKIKEPLRQEATIKDLIDHIEVTFPGFYAIVLEDLLLGLRRLLTAFTIFLVVDIVFLFHQCCACCCGIYGPLDDADDQLGEPTGPTKL